VDGREGDGRGKEREWREREGRREGVQSIIPLPFLSR